MKKTLFLFLIPFLLLAPFTTANSYLLEGTCEVYSTSGWGLSNLDFQNNQFRDSWNAVTQFTFNGNSYLFFYDRLSGEATLLDINMNFIREYTSIGNEWKHIVALDINNDGNDELLFYDPKLDNPSVCQGVAKLFNFSDDLSLNEICSYSGWRSTWKDIFAFDFNNDGRKELFFYDPYNGCSEIYRLNNDGSLANIFTTNGWRTTWKIIKPIIFSDNSTGILLYDSYNYGYGAGHIELLKYDSVNQNFTSVYSSDKFTKNIKHIITGKFNSLSKLFGDVLMYNQENGSGQFYNIGNSNLQSIGQLITGWRKNWSFITPLKMNSSNDKILFYESLNNAELCIPTYDGTNQGLHPDIILGSDGLYKLVFTPYAYAHDYLENPSVLESNDGFNFTKILNVSNPLVKIPFQDPPPIPPFHAYNNDPDIFNEGKYYYVVYNETLSNDNDYFYQNIKLLRYDRSFQFIDSVTILKQPSWSIASLSPSLIKIDGYYYLFGVYNNLQVFYLKNSSINSGWDLIQPTFINLINNSGNEFSPWHINIVFNQYRNEYYMLICGSDPGGNYLKYSLYLAKCNNNNGFTDWILYSTPILSKNEYVSTSIYRSAGIFESEENQISNNMTIYYSFYKDYVETGIGIKRNFYIDNNWFQSTKQIKTSTKLESFSYPNPFNPVTNIKYSIPKQGMVTLKVYDMLGREIKSLVNEFKQVGIYIISFDGSKFASGIYFYRIKAGDFVQVKKMVLIK